MDSGTMKIKILDLEARVVKLERPAPVRPVMPPTPPPVPVPARTVPVRTPVPQPDPPDWSEETA